MPATDDSELPDMVTVTEAAALLGKPDRTVRWMINNGLLPARQVGSAGWVIRRAVVDELRER
ncbi:helix-turn-helix domain-containing protein [Fodinicola feengrottensis]|uniref:Helix-turn-helix domain-containing protein n=1 Tax=Fodinicola feengrottensis TaxID=435914 RepID=A0ABN2IBR7_9ACTN|nr:helix-turn-helix domain-containing protein [Fodinicola feengrottensis]